MQIVSHVSEHLQAVGTAPVKAGFMARLCRLGHCLSSAGNSIIVATEVYQESVEEPSYLPVLC